MLIGLAMGKDVTELRLTYASILVVVIGLLNVVLVVIHNNRFDMHVSIARAARQKLSDVEVSSQIQKRWSLSTAWLIVASLPILAGVGLYFLK